MVLPVVARELRVRARMPSTAWLRVGAAGIAMVFGILLSGLMLKAPGGGQALFQTIGFLLFLFCLFEGVRLASGLISEERREGTLGLLFLTDLGPLEVLLGKLAGAAIAAGFALVATFPILSLALLLGGMTPGELIRGSLALVNALALALAAGAWASVRGRDGMVSMLWALAVLGLACVGPLVVELVWQAVLGIWSWDATGPGLASPVLGMTLAGESVYVTAASRYWLSQATQVLVTGALITAAARTLQRSWRDDPGEVSRLPQPAWDRARHGMASSRSGNLGAAFSRRERLQRWLRVTAILQSAGILPGLILAFEPPGAMAMGMLLQVPAALAGLTVPLLVSYVSARALGAARHSGELELMLTTPLGDQQMVRELWLELRQFAVVLTCISGCGALCTLVVHTWRLARTAPGPGLSVTDFASLALVHAGNAVDTWFGTAALIWVSLWFSLTSRRLPAAVGRAFVAVVVGASFASLLAVLLFSWMSSSVRISGLKHILGLIPPLSVILVCQAWISWARGRLRTSFRTAAAGES